MPVAKIVRYLRGGAGNSTVIPAKAPSGQLDQPEIQIAFPPDALFPPGAIPAGFDFVANVSIAEDGALTVGLRP